MNWERTPPTPDQVFDATAAADLMRQAADLIELHAAKATKHLCRNWTYQAVRHVARNCDIACPVHDYEPYVFPDPCGTFDRYEDAPWISLMSAHIAAPLAEWLRASAQDAEEIGADFRAVAFARAVLPVLPALAPSGADGTEVGR